MFIKVLLGANILKDVVVIDRPPGYAYFLFSSLDLTGQPFEMVTCVECCFVSYGVFSFKSVNR